MSGESTSGDFFVRKGPRAACGVAYGSFAIGLHWIRSKAERGESGKRRQEERKGGCGGLL